MTIFTSAISRGTQETMKGCFWGLGLIALGAGAGMVFHAMNPTQDEFEAFALTQMKQELCPKVPMGFGKDCPRFLDENQAEVKQMLRKNTIRTDYGLFSRYETHLRLRSILPPEVGPALALLPIPTGYDLATVGVMGNFYIYQAQEKKR